MWSDEARAAAAAAKRANSNGGPAPDAIGAETRARYGSMSDDELRQEAVGAQNTADAIRGKYSDAAYGEQAKRASDARSMLAGRHPSDRPAAAALANGHPKSGLVGIHSSSAISQAMTKARMAFHSRQG